MKLCGLTVIDSFTGVLFGMIKDRLRPWIIYGFTKSSQPCLLLASVLSSMLSYVVKFMEGEFETRLIDEPVAIFFDIFRRLFIVSV